MNATPVWVDGQPKNLLAAAEDAGAWLVLIEQLNNTGAWKFSSSDSAANVARCRSALREQCDAWSDRTGADSEKILALESENAELKAQLAAEKERLDFIFSSTSYVLDGDKLGYTVYVLCGAGAKLHSKDYPTPRTAIDAAIELSEGVK